MREAVEKLVKALVDNPDEVVVNEKPSDRSVMIVVQVANSDMGKLIGREGRTVKAIRSMLYAASQKHGKRFVLEIVE
jgi:predicted RNA-binding protein YlqC (UPF0109 family)